VGAGSSLEAAYTLAGPIDAGTWRLIADGIVLDPVDVTFEILWRSEAGDRTLASWEHHFEPLPGGEFEAQPFEREAEVERVDAEAGDQLVFRYTGTGSDLEMAYVPNGDGELKGGRFPYIDLPD